MSCLSTDGVTFIHPHSDLSSFDGSEQVQPPSGLSTEVLPRPPRFYTQLYPYHAGGSPFQHTLPEHLHVYGVLCSILTQSTSSRLQRLPTSLQRSSCKFENHFFFRMWLSILFNYCPNIVGLLSRGV